MKNPLNRWHAFSDSLDYFRKFPAVGNITGNGCDVYTLVGQFCYGLASPRSFFTASTDKDKITYAPCGQPPGGFKTKSVQTAGNNPSRFFFKLYLFPTGGHTLDLRFCIAQRDDHFTNMTRLHHFMKCVNDAFAFKDPVGQRCKHTFTE